MVTEKEAKEYFVKLMSDAYSKEDLARAIWKKMDCDERNLYFEELEGLNTQTKSA